MGTYNDDQEQKKIISFNLSRLIVLSEKDQKQIAIDLDINPPTFNQWVNGKAVPSVSTLKRVAAYFSVPLSAIVDPYTASDAHDLVLTDDEKELILKYRKMPLSIKGTINILLSYKGDNEQLNDKKED